MINKHQRFSLTLSESAVPKRNGNKTQACTWSVPPTYPADKCLDTGRFKHTNNNNKTCLHYVVDKWEWSDFNISNCPISLARISTSSCPVSFQVFNLLAIPALFVVCTDANSTQMITEATNRKFALKASSANLSFAFYSMPASVCVWCNRQINPFSKKGNKTPSPQSSEPSRGTGWIHVTYIDYNRQTPFLFNSI